MPQIKTMFRLFLAGLLFAAFATPVMAQQKIYSLTMSYLGSQAITGPNGTTTGPTYQAVYRNETPNGNSTINSLILAAPSGVTITNAQIQPQLATNNTLIAGVGTNSISVSYLVGIKAGGNTGYLKVQLSGSPTTCGAWSPQAFAGNAFSQPFTLQTQLSTLSVGTGTGCQVHLDMTPASVSQNSTSVPMTGTLTNTSGWAIASLRLTAPTTIGLTVPSLPTVTLPSGSASVAWCGAAICVSNISPALPPGAQLTVNLSVNVAPTCTTGLTGNWSATGYGGAAQSGTAFPTDSTSQLATGVTASPCTVSVAPSPPLNGFVGTALPPVTVTVSGGTGSGTASVTASGCTLTPASTTSLPITGSVAFSNLFITGASAACTLTFGVTGYPGTASYGAFTVFATGPIACQPSPPYSVEASDPGAVGNINAPGYWLIQRGAYNKDGGPCQEIGITASNNIVGSGTGQSVTLNWDTGLQPGAAFLSTVTWNPEYVDMTTGGTGLPKFKTKVNWTGSPYPTPVAGRACIAWNPTKVVVSPFPVHYLPFPYGQLGADVASPSTTSITVVNTGTVIPPNAAANSVPPTPFAITIDNERMTVTDTSATPVWTVVRGAGNTTAARHCAVGKWNGSSCSAGPATNVMSNPLPIADDGNQQRMCIAEEGWSIVPAGAPNCPVLPAPGGATVPTSCALVTTTVYDIGDGLVTRGLE